MIIDVVIIDDDQDDLHFIEQAIKAEAPMWQCKTFSTPEEALHALIHDRTVHPRLIFTDINMPRITGDEVVRILRQHRDFDPISIVVLSTSISPEITARLLAMGANFTFQKPAKFSRYRDIIAHLMAEHVG